MDKIPSAFKHDGSKTNLGPRFLPESALKRFSSADLNMFSNQLQHGLAGGFVAQREIDTWTMRPVLPILRPFEQQKRPGNRPALIES